MYVKYCRYYLQNYKYILLPKDRIIFNVENSIEITEYRLNYYRLYHIYLYVIDASLFSLYSSDVIYLRAVT